MKFLFLVITIATFDLSAQNLILDVDGAAIGANGVVRFNDPSMMGEKKGTKIDYSDVRGSCFLDTKWCPAIVRLRSKGEIKFPKLRLNLYTNDIHYLNMTGFEMAADSKYVEDISLFDQYDSTKIVSTLKKYIVDGKESFFLELNKGKVVLLKRIVVTLFKGDYDVSKGKNDFRFVRKVDYFLNIQYQILPIKDIGKESISAYIPLDERGYNWLAMKKNKLKTEANFIEFLDYYNSVLN